MAEQHSELERRVIALVAEALDRDPTTVELHSSLIDDLGAESIDFIDLVFRVETQFEITVPEDELWRGSGAGQDSTSIDELVARMRQRLPGFRWDRLPARITVADLPHLVTVATIVDYLTTRGVGAEPEAPS